MVEVAIGCPDCGRWSYHEENDTALICPYCRGLASNMFDIRRFEIPEVYNEDRNWFIDKVPVTETNRFQKIEYVGMLKRQSLHFSLVDSAGPSDDIWFAFNVRIVVKYLCSELCLATSIKHCYMDYIWLTPKTLAPSKSKARILQFNTIEKAYVAASVQNVLVGNHQDIGEY